MTSFHKRWLTWIRERFHPVYRLRQVPPIRWLLARIDRPWMTRIDGIPHPVAVRLGRNLGTVLSRGVAEESEERELLIGLARANGSRSYWDVGANYGLFTFALRAADPMLRIEAFEPDPDCLALLQRTLKDHGPDRVRLHGLALSGSEGSARFKRDLLTGATGGLIESGERPAIIRAPRSNPRIIEVATSTMDVESAKLGMPDIVKIDVEGSELDVLLGGERTLRAHRPILLVECTRRQDEVRQILEDVGYEVRDPRSPANPVPGPGMPFMALAIDPHRHRLVEQRGLVEQGAHRDESS